jgi:aminopeptidase N
MPKVPSPAPQRRAELRSVLVCRMLVVAAIAVLAIARVARSAEQGEVCRYQAASGAAPVKNSESSSQRRYAPDRQVDVTHIMLDVTPDFDRRSIAGTATLRFAAIATPLESLRLDGVNLRVTAVRSSHAVRDWSAGAEDVTIVFEHGIPVGEEAFVEIDYSTEPIEGLYFRTPAMGFPASDECCWTQGETHEARYWFPCFDYPNERASTELICHVPDDMTVVSNGRLLATAAVEGSSRKTFHWLQEKPHVSYLICFIAGRLAKIESLHGDTPLAFYTQPSKAGFVANGFLETADIMDFYEKEIGVPFPWDKYDQATIADFMWGGMENTSLTTLTQRTLFEHAEDDEHMERARSLNAHEMAHQWFGDYVTCKDWSHVWLNEGFATYYAHLYDGHKFGRDALLYGLYLDARDEIFPPGNVRDTRPIVFRKYKDAQDQFDFRNYPKASWVLHMLRSQVGDELYRQAIHTYLQRHALSDVETEDLRKVFEELSGKPLDQFFDQWLYHGGLPRLTVTYDWVGKENLAHVTVEQTQTTGDDVLLFEFPTKLRFIVDGKTIDEPIEIIEKKQDFYVRLPAEPQIVRFDPEYSLLAQVEFEKSNALLEADLKNADDMMGRVFACEGLAKRSTGTAVAALRTALQSDPFFGVRQAAGTALREIRTDEAVTALVDSCDQKDVRVRKSVVEELGKCYNDGALKKLLAIAADESELPVVAAAAVVGLGRSSDEAAKSAVRAALASRSFNNERAAAAFTAIHESADPAWADDLRTALNERQVDVDASELTHGIVALAEISQRGRRRNAAYEFFAGLLDSPREALRLAAIEALGQLHDARARALLEPFAAEGQIDRIAAAAKHALGELDDRAEFVPDEVRDLRRELDKLRESQDKLEKTVDELKSKAVANPSDEDAKK